MVIWNLLDPPTCQETLAMGLEAFELGGIPVGSINGNMFGPTVTARAFAPTGWLAPTAPTLLFLAKQWAGFPAHEGGGTATTGTGFWV